MSDLDSGEEAAAAIQAKETEITAALDTLLSVIKADSFDTLPQLGEDRTIMDIGQQIANYCDLVAGSSMLSESEKKGKINSLLHHLYAFERCLWDEIEPEVAGLDESERTKVNNILNFISQSFCNTPIIAQCEISRENIDSSSLVLAKEALLNIYHKLMAVLLADDLGSIKNEDLFDKLVDLRDIALARMDCAATPAIFEYTRLLCRIGNVTQKITQKIVDTIKTGKGDSRDLLRAIEIVMFIPAKIYSPLLEKQGEVLRSPQPAEASRAEEG